MDVTEETTFKLCRREPVEKEGQAVVYCAKPIKTPNASNWCDECRQRLPFWPAGDAVEPVALPALLLIAPEAQEAMEFSPEVLEG